MGRVIGKSELNRYATVFQVEAHEYEEKSLAAKCVDEDALANVLVQEYNILKDLAHTNIVKVHELIGAGQALLMELCHGQALSKQMSILAEQHRYGIVQQVLSAVEYLHVMRRITHNDIKPENLVVNVTASNDSRADTQITVKLIDFGSASFFEEPFKKNPVAKTANTLSGDSNELKSVSDSNDSSSSFKDFVDPRIVPPPSTHGCGSPCQFDIYAVGLVCAGLLRGRATFTCDIYSSGHGLQLGSCYSALTTEYVGSLLSQIPDKRPDACTAQTKLPPAQHWASASARAAADADVE
jgi:serine/threonine protein kinase